MMLRERAELIVNGAHLGCDDIPEPTPIEAQVDRFTGMVIVGDYVEAYTALRAEKSLTAEEKKMVIDAINEACLFKRQLEWGNHGIRRSFRFWTTPQKVEYLGRAVDIIDALRTLTPNVSFGFGSVLGFIRDRDFIPHDDDMDIIIGLHGGPGASFAIAKAEIKSALEDAGLTVKGDHLSHYNVVRGSYAGIDVFAGFIDPDGRVSWFPSNRSILRADEVFPARAVSILGIECPIPRAPERYLEAVYGAGWRQPQANWNHPWDQRQYEDFL